MYNLKEIYHQAQQDEECGVVDSLDYGARICRAIKIAQCYETEEVVIFNTTLGGDYYKEITKDEYDIFCKKGWKIGIYVLSLSNYRRKLLRIDDKIKTQITENKSAKSIKMFKQRRLNILTNFSEVSKKLKQLQDE
jgi:hypothetical protein